MLKVDEEIKNDPKYFFEKYLGADPWEKQWEIVYSVRDNRKTTIRSCHASGKTWIVARVALWFLYAFPPAIVIDTAPTSRQVKNQFWREFRIAHQKALRPLGGQLLKTQFEIDENWYALGFSTKETEHENVADKFQGFHGLNILFIVDEASGVSPSIFEAIDGGMSGGLTTRLIYIGNPTKKTGYFSDSFKDPSFSKFRISAFDTPNLRLNGIKSPKDLIPEKIAKAKLFIPGLADATWVKDMFDKYGEDSDVWRVRVLGEFPVSEADTLIGVDEVENAFEREVEQEGEQEILGLDPARFGGDRTIFSYRKGNFAKNLAKIYNQDTMEISGIATRFLRQYPEAILNIDIVGIGAGIYDRLIENEQLRPRVFAVNVGERASDKEQYKNLRAELFWTLKDWLKNAILEKDDDFYELANMKYKYTSLGQLQIESKEEMKKRGLKSPDVADALSLTFANIRQESNLADLIKLGSKSKPLTAGLRDREF